AAVASPVKKTVDVPAECTLPRSHDEAMPRGRAAPMKSHLEKQPLGNLFTWDEEPSTILCGEDFDKDARRQPSEGAETADGALRRHADGPVSIRLTKRPPEQRPPRKTENGRGGRAQAAFQCRRFLSMGPHRGGIDARERHRRPLPQRRRPACNSSDPRRSGSSAADQDGRQPPSRCLDSSPGQQHVASSRGPKLRTHADKQLASHHEPGGQARAT
ncbi:hypothetical protein HPB47_020786, partial [Ixodes persulcatus]